MDCISGAKSSEACMDVISVKLQPHLFTPAVNALLFI